MPTSLPAAKEAVKAALDGAEGLDGVRVARGKEPNKKEYVWIFKGKAKRDFASLGPKPPPLDENVEVTLRIVAIKGDDVASEDRAYELFNAVETVLRDNPDLSEDILFQRISEVEDGHVLFDQKWGFHIIATVTAKARI